MGDRQSENQPLLRDGKLCEVVNIPFDRQAADDSTAVPIQNKSVVVTKQFSFTISKVQSYVE